jgi:hypothetical protein
MSKAKNPVDSAKLTRNLPEERASFPFVLERFESNNGRRRMRQ